MEGYKSHSNGYAKSKTSAKHVSQWLCLLLISLLCITPVTYANDLGSLLTGAKTPEPSDKVISPTSTPQNDRKIRKRLQEIFTELDDLKGLKVEANKGVVTLSGEIDSADIEKRAIQYARQVEGVVEVENNLLITKNIKRRVNTALDRLYSATDRLTQSLPLLILGLGVVIIFWLFGRWLSRCKGLFTYLTPNAFIAELLSQIVRIVLIFIGIVLALILLDATSLIGTVLGAAGIVGLAIGFAIRDTVENYIASVLLSLRNPFEPNDWVSIEGYEGSVIRLTSRATILMTADGNHVRIPNSTVFKGIITNYTRNPKRRFSFSLLVDGKDDLVSKQQIILQALNGIEGVLNDPMPKTAIQKAESDCAEITVFGWVDQQQFSFTKVRSEAIRLVKRALQDEGLLKDKQPVSSSINHKGKTSHTNANDQPSKSSVSQPPAVDVQDIKPDDALEKQINDDRQAEDGENLLSPDAPKE